MTIKLPPNCNKCGRRGVEIVKQRSALYERAGSKTPEVEVSIPCECRIRQMVIDWLRPLTIQYSTTWAEQRKSLLDRDIVASITTHQNVLVDGSLYGCCVYFVEALKRHLQSNGLDGFLPYVVTNDMELRAWYWEHEKTNLDEVDWNSQKLLIILIGQLRMKTGDNSSQLISSRIAQANAHGNRVWIGYHSSLNLNSKDNINWSRELSETVQVYDFQKVVLNSPFDRMSDPDPMGGRAPIDPLPSSGDKYDRDFDVSL